jgi:outer membrane protein assembly factor BamA
MAGPSTRASVLVDLALREEDIIDENYADTDSDEEQNISTVYSEKHKRFGIKLYKLCDRFGYTFDMSVYLGKQKNNADTDITPTHGTMLELVRKVEGVGHKIFMDNYFTSPKLFNDHLSRKISACRTIRHNRRGCH